MKEARLMDQMSLAYSVGVWDPEAHYQYQLAKIDRRHAHRVAYMKGAFSFAMVFAVYLLIAYIIAGVTA